MIDKDKADIENAAEELKNYGKWGPDKRYIQREVMI